MKGYINFQVQGNGNDIETDFSSCCEMNIGETVEIVKFFINDLIAQCPIKKEILLTYISSELVKGL